MSFDISQTVEDGIERIAYIPHERKFKTPIVMQHGMWHGAWCWETWQSTLAELGWESHSHSLPGHGQSPTQRSLRWCTLGYYLEFLEAEVKRHEQKPILMGHSMGGALTQWYLKKVADDLPAAVLVASWDSHEMLSSTFYSILRDPTGAILTVLDLTATPMVRNPKSASSMLTSPQAIYSPEELQKRLNGESCWVLVQYNQLMWHPKKNPQTPLLWIVPEEDKAVRADAQARSARFYDADVIPVPEAAHNVMMEPNHRDTATKIHEWFVQQGIE